MLSNHQGRHQVFNYNSFIKMNWYDKIIFLDVLVNMDESCVHDYNSEANVTRKNGKIGSLLNLEISKWFGGGKLRKCML